MLVKLLKNREVLIDKYNTGKVGTQYEKNATILQIDPTDIETEYAESELTITIHFFHDEMTSDNFIGDGIIENNEYPLTNNVTQYKNVVAYIGAYVVDTETQESTLVWKTEQFDLSFNESIEVDGSLDPEEVGILEQLIVDVTVLNEETTRQATYAKNQGDYAKVQGDYAKDKGEEADSVSTEIQAKADNGDFNGKSLEFIWRGTQLGVRLEGDTEYQFVDLQGVVGPVGPQGEPFKIKKTYSSVAAMNADFNNMEYGDYVMIATSVEVEDNAKMYTRGEQEWIFITDFSGATGIIGPTGATPNIHIGTVTTLEPTEEASVTRTGTNEDPYFHFAIPKGNPGEKGDKPVKGVDYFTTAEKQEMVDSITEDATSAFNQNVTEKTTAFNNNATAKINEYNTNAATKLSEYNTNAQAKVIEFNNTVESLQDELNDLRNNQLLNTVSGDDIVVEDAYNTKARELDMVGVLEQKTTSGKNILDYITNILNSYGLSNTINNDGTITTAGIPTRNYAAIISAVDITDILTNGETYTISQSEANSNLYMQVTARNKETSQNTYYNLASASSRSFNVDKTTYSYEIIIQTGSTATWGSSSRTITSYYQLEKSSTATDFEPYTGGQPSPSPDYPQEVITTKGYSNLFDKDNVNELIAFINVSEGYIRSSSTSRVLYIPITGGKTYSVLKDVRTNVFSIATTANIPSVNMVVIDSIQQNDHSYLTINTSEEANYLVVDYWRQSSTITLEEALASIMIYEGTEEQSYVPDGGNYIYTEVRGKNLFKYSTNGWINNSGTIVTSNTNILSDYIKLKENTNYTLSASTTFLSMYFAFYDENKALLYRDSSSNVSSKTINSGVNYKYARCWVNYNDSTLDENSLETYKIQLEKGSSATDYEPYVEPVKYYTNLQGNELTNEDNLELISGVLTKNMKKLILTGNENWYFVLSGTNTTLFYAQLTEMSSNLISNYFIKNEILYNQDVEGIRGITSNNRLWLRVKQSSVADLKAWLKEKYDEENPVEVYYESSEPETIQLEPTPVKTLRGYNNINNSEGTNMDLTYVQDLQAVIDSLRGE